MATEAPATSAETVEICRKCGLSSNTFYPRRERFPESAKGPAMAGKSDTAAAKTLRRGE